MFQAILLHLFNAPHEGSATKWRLNAAWALNLLQYRDESYWSMW